MATDAFKDAQNRNVSLQLDENGNIPLLSPRKVSLNRRVNGSISASTKMTLSGQATFIRVYAIDKDVYMKWGYTAVTASNFDEVIPANQICDFYIPIESGTTLFSEVNFIERAATATIIVIEK